MYQVSEDHIELYINFFLTGELGQSIEVLLFTYYKLEMGIT